MAKIKKSKVVPKNQNAQIRCPKPFRSDYEGPGFVGRIREKIQDRIQEGRDRRAARREKPNTISRPEDRPYALDYTEPSREKRSYDILGGNAMAKKGKKVTKAKVGAKVTKSTSKKPIAKKSISKPINKKSKKK